mgnify:CR=1 FL=1
MPIRTALLSLLLAPFLALAAPAAFAPKTGVLAESGVSLQACIRPARSVKVIRYGAWSKRPHKLVSR